jgi:hypothetical protein
MDIPEQTEPDFDYKDLKIKLMERVKGIERLMIEKNNTIRALKEELEVRCVIIFHNNFKGTWNFEFLCVIHT